MLCCGSLATISKMPWGGRYLFFFQVGDCFCGSYSQRSTSQLPTVGASGDRAVLGAYLILYLGRVLTLVTLGFLSA
jgi:hypothetical protein